MGPIHKNPRLLGIVTAFFLLIPTTLPCYATSFYPRAFSETVQDAPVVVRGKIGMSYTDWAKDGGEGAAKRIYTYYEFQLSEALKGNVSGPSITIREMGGEKDGISLNVSGTAQFSRGEDVVVLLREKNSDGSYDIQGMMMGKYNVEAGPDGKEYLVGAGLMGENGLPAPKKWTLETLRSLIKSQEGEAQPSNTSKETSPSPKSQSSTLPSSKPSESSNDAASQLQSSKEENGKSGAPLFQLLAGLVGVGLLIGLLGIFRRRK